MSECLWELRSPGKCWERTVTSLAEPLCISASFSFTLAVNCWGTVAWWEVCVSQKTHPMTCREREPERRVSAGRHSSSDPLTRSHNELETRLLFVQFFKSDVSSGNELSASLQIEQSDCFLWCMKSTCRETLMIHHKKISPTGFYSPACAERRLKEKVFSRSEPSAKPNCEMNLSDLFSSQIFSLWVWSCLVPGRSGLSRTWTWNHWWVKWKTPRQKRKLHVQRMMVSTNITRKHSSDTG